MSAPIVKPHPTPQAATPGLGTSNALCACDSAFLYPSLRRYKNSVGVSLRINSCHTLDELTGCFTGADLRESPTAARAHNNAPQLDHLTMCSHRVQTDRRHL